MMRDALVVACLVASFAAGYYVRDYGCKKQMKLDEAYCNVKAEMHEEAAVLSAVEKQKELCKRGLR